jgi:hypothetical protein
LDFIKVPCGKMALKPADSVDFPPADPVQASPVRHSAPRKRTTFDLYQRTQLEGQFRLNPYPDSSERRKLAEILGVKESSIMWWFGHRRAKEVKRQERRAAGAVVSDTDSAESGHGSPDRLGMHGGAKHSKSK